MAKTYKTRNELRTALDCSAAALSRFLKRDDWPCSRTGPWSTADVVKVQKWRAAELREDRSRLDADPAGPTVELRRQKLTAEIRKLSAQAARAELALEHDKGEYIPREEVEAGRIARIYDVKARMQELVNRAPELANRGAEDVRTILESWFKEVCNAYAGEG